MIYLAFILALSLACVAGVQFFYLMFLHTVNHYDKRRVEELEIKLRRTEKELELKEQELEIAEQRLELAQEPEDDAWPEIIDS